MALDLTAISAGAVASEVVSVLPEVSPLATIGTGRPLPSLEQSLNSRGTGGSPSANAAFVNIDATPGAMTSGNAAAGSSVLYNQGVPVRAFVNAVPYGSTSSVVAPGWAASEEQSIIESASRYLAERLDDSIKSVIAGIAAFATSTTHDTGTPSLDNSLLSQAASARRITTAGIHQAIGNIGGDYSTQFRYAVMNSTLYSRIVADHETRVISAIGTAGTAGLGYVTIGDITYINGGSILASGTVGSVSNVFPVVVLKEASVLYGVSTSPQFRPFELERDARVGAGQTTAYFRALVASGVVGVNYTVTSLDGTNLGSTATQVESGANYEPITNITGGQRGFLVVQGT